MFDDLIAAVGAEHVLPGDDPMVAVLEIDPADAVAVVEPGVSLAALDAAAGEHGLTYPVHPGALDVVRRVRAALDP